MSQIINIPYHTMSTTLSLSTISLRPLSLPLRRHHFSVKCSGDGDAVHGGDDLNKAVSKMVNKNIVDDILKREENKGLLEGLEKASERVERAKRDLADIEKREVENQIMKDYITQLETRANKIAECQREILEARAMVEEAERSLSLENEESNKTVERLESAKAASVSALVGILAGLPFYLTQVSENYQLILPLAITFVSCALFGVTFRYAVRRDLDDFHLKTGAAAAFGVIKGLATLEGGPPLELESANLFAHAISGAIYVSENLLVFTFAAIALDFCFKMRLVSPFPIQKSSPDTETR